MSPAAEVASAAASAMTVAAVQRSVSERLAAAGIDEPQADARLLLAHALGVSRGRLVGMGSHAVSKEELARLDRLVRRRQAHEPLAYIVGEKEFWSLPLAVSPAVLIPRPDTETVVEAALAFIEAKGARADPWRLADLGTGSGALLIALLSELPHASGVGIDISAQALGVAQANGARHGLSSRALFVRGSFAAPLDQAFDLIVSNPPYIETAAIAALAPDVRAFEPFMALDGGPDGLDAYRAIFAQAVQALNPRGALVLEIGAGQEKAVTALAAAGGLIEAASPRPDLAGIPRAVVFEPPG